MSRQKVAVGTCLDAHKGNCEGGVEYHLNPDRDDFKAFPRCRLHQQARLKSAEEHFRKYPVNPPRSFSELDANESWDEDGW